MKLLVDSRSLEANSPTGQYQLLTSLRNAQCMSNKERTIYCFMYLHPWQVSYITILLCYR